MKTPEAVVAIGVPLDLGAGRRGVDMGPSAIRVAGLHDKFDSLKMRHEDWGDIVVANPGHRSDINPKHKYLPEIKETCQHLRDQTYKAKQQNLVPIVLGGDHSLAMGSVAGVANFYREQKKQIGLIWVDAHTDMNTPNTSYSGNVHGMPLAHIIALGEQRLINLAKIAPMIKPENVVIIGARSVDTGETKIVKGSGVTVFTMRSIDDLGMHTVMNEAIKIATADTAGFHLSFDLDACAPEVAPGVGTPVQGGLTYRESHYICERIADSGALLSMDMVELNSTLDHANKTAKLAVGLIGSCLGESIL